MKKGAGDVACCPSSLEYLNVTGCHIDSGWFHVSQPQSDVDCLGPMAYLEAAKCGKITSPDANSQKSE